MVPESLKQELIRDLKQLLGMYKSDLDAMSPETLTTRPHGAHRSPLDYTYEVALVNHRIAARLRGEHPGPMPDGPWVMAPTGDDAVATVLEEFKASGLAVVAAAEALPAERYHEVPHGLKPEDGSNVGLITFVCIHLAYHDGQLNLTQSMNGDQEVHWLGMG